MKQPDGRYRYPEVRIKAGRPIAPTSPVPDFTVSYRLRYVEDGRRKHLSLGYSLDKAFIDFRNFELNYARKQQGLAPIHGGAALVQDFKEHTASRTRIDDTVVKYISDLDQSVAVGKRAKGTWRGYKNAVNDFQKYCHQIGVQYLDEITGDVLRGHEVWLYKTMQRRVRGKQSNTVAKRFRFLNTFFNRFGITMIKDQRNPNGLLNRRDVPLEEKPQHINRYSPEEIQAMLSVANENQVDMIQFFLRTGCRDEEAAYLEWKDVDFKHKQIFIREKPGVWKPKDKEQRIIPTEDGVLLPRLGARRERQSPASNLVFPNTLGSPDMHLIRQLHNVVAKLKQRGIEIEGVP
ncbi:MAG: tyrosine-type recombinase/integrase, partial [Ktedonobacteraceae bacterium]